MKSQKDIFLSTEGDHWYSRNKDSYDADNQRDNLVAKSLEMLELIPSRILEIGCSNGARLSTLQKMFGVPCFGVDPSSRAIEDGEKKFPALSLQVGTADLLPFEDGAFDLIIFGFCLYLCDRKDLFQVAAEADRCLVDKGHLVVMDFCPPFPYKNGYTHRRDVYSYKMDYSKMFSWNPAYNTLYTIVSSHTGIPARNIPDEKIAVSILNKSEAFAYPDEPYRRPSEK